MALEKIVKEIVDASGKSRSSLYKLVAIFVGASLFLIVVPLLEAAEEGDREFPYQCKRITYDICINGSRF